MIPPPASNDNPKKPNRPVPEPKAPRPPMQSQLDEERGDWEGMGQGRYQPEPETEKPAPDTNRSIKES